MVNIELKYNFVETSRKFKALKIEFNVIERFAMVNLCGVSTKL